MALDFAGEIYIRQEGGAMLMGTYEQACVPWSPRETPWDFGSQLLEAGPRPDHARAVGRVQALPGDGHDRHPRVVNGPFTFSPDGNPLVGPIRGLRGYWVACGSWPGCRRAAASGSRSRPG